MKTGLVLVDIQNDYFSGGKMELVGMDEASAKAGELLAHFRHTDQPTFHIQHVFEGPDAPFFLPDTEGVKINDSVKPFEGDTVIQKHYPNGFRETSLLSEIQKAGVERVVFCGAMSHMCIDASVRAAADAGLTCMLAHDACATRDLEFGEQTIQAAEVHGAFMASLGWAYADVRSAKEILADL